MSAASCANGRLLRSSTDKLERTSAHCMILIEKDKIYQTQQKVLEFVMFGHLFQQKDISQLIYIQKNI